MAGRVSFSQTFAATLALVLALAPARAQDAAADFYRGKTILMQIGSQAGGIYDIVGRLVARHMGKYISGEPRINIQNVPGGGSLQLANQFGNITPRDGSVFGVFGNGMPTTPLFDPKVAKFDPKLFEYIGSTSREAHVLTAWRGAPVQKMEDVFTKELVLGATSPGAAFLDFPLLSNALIGTKFRIVKGYPGGTEIQLAMRRGELQGAAGVALGSIKAELSEAYRSGDLTIIAAHGMKKHRELLDIPLLPVGKTQEDRQIFELMYARQDYGRIFAAPQSVPRERVQALRNAFQATLQDPDFRAEAARAGVDVDPVAGEELAALTLRLHQVPEAVLERARALIALGN